MLEPGESVILEGRAGYETPITRGKLTLTDRRLLWEKSLSIDPFGAHQIALRLEKIRSADMDGDAIKLGTESGEVFIFPQWWALSLLTGNRRTKEWLRELNCAIKAARGGGG